MEQLVVGMNVWTSMAAAIKPLAKIYIQFKHNTVLHWHVVCPWCIQVIEEWLPHILPRLEWPGVQEQHARQWNTWRSHWRTISACTRITTYRLINKSSSNSQEHDCHLCLVQRDSWGWTLMCEVCECTAGELSTTAHAKGEHASLGISCIVIIM